MFTRLEISHKDCSITLEAHELIAILLGVESKTTAVPSLVESIPKEPCFIPKVPDYKTVIEKQMKQTDHDFISGKNDVYYLMPICVAPMNTINQYYYVTNQLREWASKIELDGWWFCLGDRVLFIKNKEKKTQFYICDYGLKWDVFDAMQRNMLKRKWHGNTNTELKEIFETYRRLVSPEEKKQTAKKILGCMPLSTLHKEYPSRTAEQLLDFHRLLSNDAEFALKIFERLFFDAEYYEKVIAPHCREFLEKNPDLLPFIKRCYPNSQRIRENLFKRAIAIYLMFKVNQGRRELFFRPYHAYGSPDSDGPSYREFADEIARYTSKTGIRGHELAKQLRDVVLNRWTHQDDMGFLPALGAAWFIAEGSRNPLTIPTNLMLLDIMENHWLATLTEDSFERLYNWQHVFIHPDETIGITDCTDLYGDAIKWDKNHKTPPIMFFRGSHPMVHFNSRPQAAPKLGKGDKLTIVRQKEASLILHWLYCHLKMLLPNCTFKLVQFDQGDPQTYLPKPDYSEISLLISQLAKQTKKFKSIQDANTLRFKFRLLQHYIIPLLHERCSTMEKSPKLFHSVPKPPVEKILAATAPAASPQAHYPLTEPLFRLTVEKNELYSLVLDTCAQYGIAYPQDLKPVRLQQIVATSLLRNYADYYDIVFEQLAAIISSQIKDTDFEWVTGLAQLFYEKNYLPIVPFDTSKINIDELLKQIQTQATLSALEATLPNVPHICDRLQKTLQLFKVLCCLWFADARWFREKAVFLTTLLKIEKLRVAEREQINKELQSIRKEAKYWDNIYYARLLELVKSEEYHLAVSDNARVQGQMICHLDLYIIAHILKIKITLLTETPDDILPAVCVQTPTGPRLFYHRKTFTPLCLSKKQQETRQVFIFKDRDDSFWQGEKTIAKASFKVPAKIPSIYPASDKGKRLIENFVELGL